MTNTLPTTGAENGVGINPSYNKELSPEERLGDFLGKYYINLNGVVPNCHLEITDPHKKEIIEFVLLLLSDQTKRARVDLLPDIELWFLRLHNEPNLWTVDQALEALQKSLEKEVN